MKLVVTVGNGDIHQEFKFDMDQPTYIGLEIDTPDWYQADLPEDVRSKTGRLTIFRQSLRAAEHFSPEDEVSLDGPMG